MQWTNIYYVLCLTNVNMMSGPQALHLALTTAIIIPISHSTCSENFISFCTVVPTDLQCSW